MIPDDRGVEEDLFAELGLVNSNNVFLKHLRSGRIKVVRGMHTRMDMHALMGVHAHVHAYKHTDPCTEERTHVQTCAFSEQC